MIGKVSVPGTVHHSTINLSLAQENTFEYDVIIIMEILSSVADPEPEP